MVSPADALPAAWLTAWQYACAALSRVAGAAVTEPASCASAISCWLYSQSPYRRQACAALALCCGAADIALWRSSSVLGRLLSETADRAREGTAARPIASGPCLSGTGRSAGALSCAKSRKASARAAPLEVPAASLTCEEGLLPARACKSQ